MKQKIAIKLANGIVLPENGSGEQIGYSLSFVANMMAYGFMPTAELANALGELDRNDIASLSKDVMPVLKELVGANAVCKPFYPNFPKQVMDADEAELFHNAQAHYFSEGKWIPDFAVNDRPVAFENVKFKPLGITRNADIDDIFRRILQSADSISGFNKDVVKWVITSAPYFSIPVDGIPFKENMCLVAGVLIEAGMWNSNLVKDTTDILRIVTYLNGGDISLSENTKFKSLPRRVRKALIFDLERVAKEEDFVRHSNKWIKLLHNLHVGDYSQKLYDIAKKLRENKKIATWNSKIEAAMQASDIPTCIALLKSRPGEFARRVIDLIYKDVHDHTGIIDAFEGVVDKVPARNLTQLLGAVKQREHEVNKRVVFPKGMVQSAYVLRNKVARLATKIRTRLINVITASLEQRFAERGDLGAVYIDPALYECPLPTGMRSASEGLREVARGTRMPIGNKNTLRFFIYWKGEDIDLSATFHDEDFKQVGHVSYTNYSADGYNSCHSGDITNAPNGASEFIDVDIQSVLDYNASYRYVAMNVLVFSGPTFAEHEECFAGWMTRDAVNSNEIFEPATVEQKIDLQSATKNVIPVIFDLKERKAIWTDISTNGKSFNGNKVMGGGNNVENNRATIEDMVEAFTSLDNKITLGDLFEMHAIARGGIVENREDADFIFAMDDADVTPYDVIDINANFL
jgi:hypothetical protein